MNTIKILVLLLLIGTVSIAQNVGIGTTTPNNTLEIKSALPAVSGLRFTNLTSATLPVVANGTSLSVDGNGDVILVPSSADAWLLKGNSNATTTSFLGTTNAFDLVFKVANTEYMRMLNTNGNGGIGTINPQRKLHLHSSANNFHAIQLTAENQTDWWDIVRRGQTYATPNHFVISHNGNLDFNITDKGNVGIAQVPDASAMLEVVSTTSGFAMPRMTTVQRIAIVAPIAGLQVYDTDLKGVYAFDGTWDCLNTPAGTVSYFANATTPRGYLVCDGASYTTTQYPELFTAIAYLYGGAGANFSVPDLRGEFVRGIDNGRGVDNDVVRTVGGNQLGTIMWYDSGPSMTVSGINMTAGADAITRNYVGFDKTVEANWPNAICNFTSVSGSNNIATNGPSHFNSGLGDYGIIGTSRPRNVALLPCIKF